MSQWSQHDVRKNMHVYSSDNEDLGHVAEVYEDSFKLHKGLLSLENRYLPYATIASIDGDRIKLTLSAEVATEKKWEKRPDYEDHLSDPLQLMYDRGHDVQVPFDETAPDKEKA